MKRILCPTDFSETANNAIAFAAKVAQVTESELVLFNVQSIFSLSPMEVIKGKSDAVALIHDQLEAQSIEVAKVFKISCYCEVQLSSVRLSNLISANAKEFDLIVMGTDGEEDIVEFFTGSNTYNVIKNASIPILLIPPDCSYDEIFNTIYAYDYLKEEKLPMDQLSVWIKLLQSKLSVLEVLEESVSTEVDDELQDFQAFIQETVPVHLTFDTIHSSRVADSINEYVLEKNGDMLALCTQHRSLLGNLFHSSVIRSISIMARYPVFVFHQ